jgi:hypothetical protein
MASAALPCPKCGFRQEADIECQRCGIIFDRYNQGSSRYQPLSFLPDAVPVVAEVGLITRFFRLLRWTAVFASVASLLLVLSSQAPPAVPLDPHAAQRFASKMERFGNASDRGAAVQVEFDEAEVNAWLRSGLIFNLAGTQNSLNDVRLQLMQNRLRAYALFNYFGAALTLMVEGQISVVDHHLRFEPTSGKLGSLPLPQGVLNSMTRRVFHNVQLPPAISSIAVHRGALTVSTIQ